MLLVCELRGVEPITLYSYLHVSYEIYVLIGIRIGVDCAELLGLTGQDLFDVLS